MKLIGFNGKMGVGKSTAIECLKESTPFPENVKLVKFAQPLYDMQEFIYRRVASVHQRQSGFTKDRKLLQWLGTDWGRDTISQTLWVDIWKAEVKRLHEAYPNAIIVCDDVRFDNEAEAIKGLGGTIISIRSSAAEKRIDTKAGISNHSSEAGIALGLIDMVISNDGTRQDFMNQMTGVYKELGILPDNQRSE